MSLVKFLNRQQSNGRGKLWWSRAEKDGLPYRGFNAPMMTEEEFEDRTVRVADPHNGTFRTWIEEENKAYLDVVDKILNHWAACLYQDSWKQKIKIEGVTQVRHVHYLVWAEYYLEDGSRSQLGPLPMEMSHGQGHVPGNPF